MQAHYYKKGDYTVIEVKGRIEADQNKPFRDVCEKQLKNKSVVFCLAGLNFTASANIITFFESISMIEKVKLVGLAPDFFRLLDLKGLNHFKVFKTLNEAVSENVAPISILPQTMSIDEGDGEATAQTAAVTTLRASQQEPVDNTNVVVIDMGRAADSSKAAA